MKVKRIINPNTGSSFVLIKDDEPIWNVIPSEALEERIDLNTQKPPQKPESPKKSKHTLLHKRIKKMTQTINKKTSQLKKENLDLTHVLNEQEKTIKFLIIALSSSILLQIISLLL